MKTFNRSDVAKAAVFVFAAAIFAGSRPAWAQTETILYGFGLNEGQPFGGVVFDNSGNLYGGTGGGTAGEGSIVYELSPAPAGGWTESLLHTFGAQGDGNQASGALVFDEQGNLYGTTSYGGLNLCSQSVGCGTVFELSKMKTGGWQEQVLYSFRGADGAWPASSLALNTQGNLYGTTVGGGTYGLGIVFELRRNTADTWSEAVLHSFAGGGDGARPGSSLVFDAKGNLYGTTAEGGGVGPCYLGGCGTAFVLTPGQSGAWTETVIHSFSGGRDGAGPVAGLVFDSVGNLYGTAYAGGDLACTSTQTKNIGCGTVFELSPAEGGGWTDTTLHEFKGGSDGNNPVGGLVSDTQGNLYGSTEWGGGKGECFDQKGAQNFCGSVYELSPAAAGWTERVLYGFGKNASDGDAPSSSLVLDSMGNLYGTTGGGGQNGYGIAFEITP
jgi:uncharacterized repeat protein (TIGR03803 family)